MRIKVCLNILFLLLWLILLHILKHCMIPSLSKQIDNILCFNGPNGQRYCRFARGDACSNRNAIANITCIGLETQSDPEPTVLVINENHEDFFILVNCKTPSNTGQIIVTSPDQKPQMVVIVWEMGPLFQGTHPVGEILSFGQNIIL